MTAEDKQGIKISSLGLIFTVVYLLVTIGTTLLEYSSEDEFFVSRLAGKVIATCVLAGFFSWFFWMVFRRSNFAASVTLCVVMFFGTMSSIGAYLAHQRNVRNVIIAQFEKDVEQLAEDHVSLLEDTMEGDVDSSERAMETLDKAVKVMERAAKSSSGKDAYIARIAADLIRELQGIQDNYYKTFDVFQNHGGFDISTITDLDHLESRKQLLQEFMQANEDFDNYYADIEKSITTKVLAGGYSESDAQIFINNARQASNWDLTRAIRDCDRRACIALNNILDLIKNNWTLVLYDTNQKTLLINDDDLYEQCQVQFIIIQEVGDEQIKLQNKAIENQKQRLKRNK